MESYMRILLHRQVLFYTWVTFLKNVTQMVITQIEHKIPI